MNSFVLEKQSINQWVKMEKTPRDEELTSRCTTENVQQAVKEFKEVKVLSARMETGKPDWPDAFHVVLTETSPGNHIVTINIWMPLDWNGRFLGCVGGGLRTLHIYQALGDNNRIAMPPQALRNGFATANTDGGVPGEALAWGLNEETKAIDYELILNFAYRSTHSMSIIAKAVITAVYGEAPKYSYLTGASGGGRQSLTEAQLYPQDYDGIWAVDPAVNWTGLFTAFIWPIAVMNEEKHILTPEKLEYFRKAAIEKSGGKHDFIESADMPDFDPYEAVGKETADGVITEKDAKVMKLVSDGARTRDGHFLWYGYRLGTHFWSHGILGEAGCFWYAGTSDGQKPKLNDLANGYIGAWVERDLNWDWEHLDYRKFEEIFKKSQADLGVLECNRPDLYDFCQSGAKLIISHAVNEDTIPGDGTIDYYKRVCERMGGEEAVRKYARLFMSPGGGHTDIQQPGLSFTLSDGMIALMRWVEEGTAPETISAGWYNFELNDYVLTGKVPVYRIGKPNPALDIQETPAYGKMLDSKNTPNSGASNSRFSSNSTLREIMEDQRGKEILDANLAELLGNSAFKDSFGIKIGDLQTLIPFPELKKKISEVILELEKLR